MWQEIQLSFVYLLLPSATRNPPQACQLFKADFWRLFSCPEKSSDHLIFARCLCLDGHWKFVVII